MVFVFVQSLFTMQNNQFNDGASEVLLSAPKLLSSPTNTKESICKHLAIQRTWDISSLRRGRGTVLHEAEVHHAALAREHREI
jgi:hypothetical protein